MQLGTLILIFLMMIIKKILFQQIDNRLGWEADEELIEIKENLNKLTGIIQREWRKRRSEAKEKKAQENIQKIPP